MNLKDKRTRRIAAVCASAVTLTAGGVAVSALAAGQTLAFGPTDTSATITDLDVTASLANAETAYGLKVTGASASDTDPLRISVLSGPATAGAAVLSERVQA